MQKGNAAATAAFSLTGCRQHAANSRPGIVWASLHAGRRTLRSPHSSQGDAARCGGRFIRPVTSRAVECSAVQQSAAPSCCRHRRAQGICCAAASSTCTDGSTSLAEAEVLGALARIIDPDFGEDIVSCGFVRDLIADPASGRASFRLQLTTPACPVKAEFERLARQYVGAIPWVEDLTVVMSADPPKPVAPAAERPGGLASVKHIIAVSSCKGGVGKSTTAVNLAFTLLQMGGSVGIFDADVYGPSLPTMTSPEYKQIAADPVTRELTPVEYAGVKCMSFGWAGQGSAIMRGAMSSGLITQLLTQTQWGDLDYLVVDFPPGTGDIQLTLCQTMGISAAVIVTTPQQLAYVDVVKGIRMFARLQVPCVAAVENMSYFDGDDGKRYYPFGAGSGDRLRTEFGLPHLLRFPIAPAISAAGDGGTPLVVADPSCETAAVFMELGAAVVREVAKLDAMPRNAVRFDEAVDAFEITLPSGGNTPGTFRPLSDSSAAGAQQPVEQPQQQQPSTDHVSFTSPTAALASAALSDVTAASSDVTAASSPTPPLVAPGSTPAETAAAAAHRAAAARSFYVDPVVMRANDTSAAAIDEWTGERLAPQAAEGVRPASVSPCGNYAVQILWDDGFNQVAPFELLATLDRLTPEQVQQRAAAVVATAEAVPAGPPPAAPPIAPAESSNGSGDAPEATSEAQRILAAAQGR